MSETDDISKRIPDHVKDAIEMMRAKFGIRTLTCEFNAGTRQRPDEGGPFPEFEHDGSMTIIIKINCHA